jgi:hypothetical protein
MSRPWVWSEERSHIRHMVRPGEPLAGVGHEFQPVYTVDLSSWETIFLCNLEMQPED